ncbi:hypothetical protein P872_12915 [Rhodonellum psychrophilum GCM71 = DSM 17998]|uniref:Glycosyltransferase RgtA/B/C/D-like domain-containing protein n=2 Tax=Rhodonellum TaxID=336827 RepID=U5BVJ5_9BACT|nr:MULTISPECIES: hypothetical protein [Rhodonellum]ERM80626.1 hypothetical protein P872_12915 [Rhodonellum psychrophilum GCM71 = DSM 17998]MDO9551786.1 hypothetical protein [Rhodonellum sp.]SDZ16926.1 hypothetical protein SAMN05444412_1073 [Rhodonellum ikkaensis]
MIAKITTYHIFILIGAILYMVAYLLPFRFQVNDDVLMMWLVSGAYTGEFETYAVFIHPLLSHFFAFCYRNFPSIPWYPLTWFLVVYLAYVQWVRIVLSQEKLLNQRIFWIVLFLTYAIHHLYFLQFTAVAGIAAFSGILGLVLQLQGKKGTSSFLAYVLILLSVLIRTDAFFLMVIGFGTYWLLHQGFKEIHLVIWRQKWLIFGVLFLIGYRVHYENREEIKDYVAFNKARSGVIDHPVFQMNKALIDREEEPEWFYFKEWLFEDAQKISTADLVEKKKGLNKGYFDLFYFKTALSRVLVSTKYEYYKKALFFFFFSLALWVGFRQKKTFWFLFIWVVFFLSVNHFFLLAGRVQTLFILILLGVAFLNRLAKIPMILGSVFVLLCLALMGIHSLNVVKAEAKWAVWNKDFYQLLDQVPDGEKVFVHAYSVELLNRKYDFQNPPPMLQTGWISRSPMQKRAFQRFGVNAFREIDRYYLVQQKADESSQMPGYFQYLELELTKTKILSNTIFEMLKYEK